MFATLQAALRQMCSAHKENLPTLLKCTIFNELSNARNHNNMAMLYVMFTADPVLAPASLAAVFLELLMQKECYLVRTAQFFAAKNLLTKLFPRKFNSPTCGFHRGLA